MAYLNVDPAYFTHRKTLRLVARLGQGAEVLPIKLWAYCAAHHPKDGALLGYDQAELEALLGHKEAVLALVAVGFLDVAPDGQGWVCHDWLEHQGHLAAFKDRAERGAKARWDKARMLKAGASNAKPEPKHSSSNAPSLPTVPAVPVTALPDTSGDDGENGKTHNYSGRFETFWNFYPRKIGKGKAWAVFKRLSAADQDAAVEQAEAYAQAYEMAPDQRRQYFKHPATWLNARSWEDDHAEWSLLIEGK